MWGKRKKRVTVGTASLADPKTLATATKSHCLCSLCLSHAHAPHILYRVHPSTDAGAKFADRHAHTAKWPANVSIVLEFLLPNLILSDVRFSTNSGPVPTAGHTCTWYSSSNCANYRQGNWQRQWFGTCDNMMFSCAPSTGKGSNPAAVNIQRFTDYMWNIVE